jgi:hypothetical protein
MREAAPRFPHKILFTGVGLLVLGGVLLLWSLGRLPSLEALWPLPLILVGLVLLALVFVRGYTRLYVPPGMLLVLGGIFFLLHNTVIPNVKLEEIWPVFMLIGGISILPFAHKKARSARLAIIIAAAAIIGLAVIFLPFSLGLVDKSFTEFVLRWWPTMLLLMGALLIITYYIRR